MALPVRCIAAVVARIAFLLAAAVVPVSSTYAASDPQAATTLRAEDLRIARIAYHIAIGARGLCVDPYPVTGLLLHHLAEYDPAARRIQIARYALDRGPGVLATVEDSPAARSGLAAGDVLLSVNGKAFPDPRTMTVRQRRGSWRKDIDASEALLENALRAGPARLLVLRDHVERDVELNARPGCAARVRLARSSQANAFSDGVHVVVTTRILDFVRSDDELAVVIGHELAHNLLGHKAQLEAQGVSGGLLAGIGKNASRIRATEEAADRFGLRLAWTGGYDVRAATAFWQRFYARFGSGLRIFATHPGMRTRESLVNETISELSHEQQPGVPR